MFSKPKTQEFQKLINKHAIAIFWEYLTSSLDLFAISALYSNK